MDQRNHFQQDEVIQEDRRRHFHVLAVDDSKIDRKILEQLLTISSYQVTSVESGDKALEYLGLVDNSVVSESSQQEGQGMSVNLIMTDYSMPGMSGYDLLRKLKGSSWKDVPVVVMSSENVPSRIHMCLEGGAEEFLLKPVQLSDMKKLQPYITKSSVQSDEIAPETMTSAKEEKNTNTIDTNTIDENNMKNNVVVS